jgi:NAD(P)-dependent dehydrogenase (short-subunit alcohol dehydrogenase family)
VNPSYDFSGLVAFLTGASSGMGLATARAFAEAGAAVTLADVNDDALAAAEAELSAAGHRVLAVHCNVAEESRSRQLWHRRSRHSVGSTWPTTTPASNPR